MRVTHISTSLVGILRFAVFTRKGIRSRLTAAQIVPIYTLTEAPHTDMNVPFDGTCVTLGTLNLLPTSRGSVRLASTDPADDPLIDPNYYATEADHVVMRAGIRLASSAVEPKTGQTFFGEEFTPKGFPPLTNSSANAEIDARVKRAASTWFHPA